jgi:hypothetical protein
MLIIFGGPYYFRRPTPSRRKLSAIFGGLTWPPEIRLFSAASDTVAENKPFKNRRPHLLLCFSSLLSQISRRRRSPPRPRRLLARPPARCRAARPRARRLLPNRAAARPCRHRPCYHSPAAPRCSAVVLPVTPSRHSAVVVEPPHREVFFCVVYFLFSAVVI